MEIIKSQPLRLKQPPPFAPTGEVEVYDNINGKYIAKGSADKPGGMKIGNLYFSYKMENIDKVVDEKTLKGWAIFESYSQTGLNG